MKELEIETKNNAFLWPRDVPGSEAKATQTIFSNAVSEVFHSRSRFIKFSSHRRSEVKFYKLLCCLTFISATCNNVNNCTGPRNGICRRTDECRCHDGYIGKDRFLIKVWCSDLLISETLNRISTVFTRKIRFKNPVIPAQSYVWIDSGDC